MGCGSAAVDWAASRCTGKLAVTVVPLPGEDAIWTVPWSSWTRSRMPSRPNPEVLVAGSNPSPSSRTVSSTRVGVLADFDHGPVGVAVFGGVGQRLLDDPVDRGLELGGVARRFAALLVGELDRAVDLQAVAARAFAQRGERGLEAELIQCGRPQIGDERAEVGDPVLEMVDRLSDGFFEHLQTTLSPSR